jgi:hypothetical protein
MEISDLRRHVIECRTLKEMRIVWETLKGMGEDMYCKEFLYDEYDSIAYGRGWGVSGWGKPTLSYSAFMAEFGPNQDIDRDFLRKQVVGGFQSLDEMREAWELLKASGEKMLQHKFLYQAIYTLSRPYNKWRAVTELPATMSLQELKTFIGRPSAPIEEDIKSDESMCTCKSLIHGHSLGCHYFKER